MKFPRNFLFLILLLRMIPLSAQEHSCNLNGRVIDGKSKSPIGFAAVTLHSKKDSSLITGSLTDEQGLFTINGVAPGLYRLKVKYMGYQTYVKDSVSMPAHRNQYIRDSDSDFHNAGSVDPYNPERGLKEIHWDG